MQRGNGKEIKLRYQKKFRCRPMCPGCRALEYVRLASEFVRMVRKTNMMLLNASKEETLRLFGTEWLFAEVLNI